MAAWWRSREAESQTSVETHGVQMDWFSPDPRVKEEPPENWIKEEPSEVSLKHEEEEEEKSLKQEEEEEEKSLKQEEELPEFLVVSVKSEEQSSLITEQSPETDTGLKEERAVSPMEMPEPAATITHGPRLTATSRPRAADVSGSAETISEMNGPSTSSAMLERQSLGSKRKRVQEPAFEPSFLPYYQHIETLTRMLSDFMQADERRYVESMQREERFRHEDANREDMRLERMMLHQTNLMQRLLADHSQQESSDGPLIHYL